jgi:hypothetical protein
MYKPSERSTNQWPNGGTCSKKRIGGKTIGPTKRCESICPCSVDSSVEGNRGREEGNEQTNSRAPGAAARDRRVVAQARSSSARRVSPREACRPARSPSTTVRRRSAAGVNTKNWYWKGTDLWAEFGDEIPFS